MRVILVSALVGGGVGALSPATAHAAVLNAQLVNTVSTGGSSSNWAHPSPDPSGITYNSRTGQLIISDGEVEENNPTKYPNNVWKGTNLFVASLKGALLETGANTLAYTREPTGVAFRPNLSAAFPERLFVSDDDRARVFEVDRGADGRYGTADDRQTSFSVAFTGYGAPADAEDVTVDLELTRNSQLLIVDGTGRRVFVYSPGPDNVFNGQAAEGGDDRVERVINVAALGAVDPEGIAYNPSRNTVFVLDDPSNQLYELSLQGNLVNTVKLPFTMTKGAGIAFAPPSNGSGGAHNAYLVDRGVDNDANQSTFNDGRIFEIAIPGSTGGGGGGSGTVDVPIRGGSDDAEEVVSSGAVRLTSGDLNMVRDGGTVQTVGLRFTGVAVPKNATITKAYVQFRVDEVVAANAATLTIAGHAADNAGTFTTTARNVSSRPRTTGVTWNVPEWPSVGARTATQQTPDLKPVLQEIVNRAGWASGNALALIVTGSGTRVAESYEGGAARAPVLHVEYSAP